VTNLKSLGPILNDPRRFTWRILIILFGPSFSAVALLVLAVGLLLAVAGTRPQTALAQGSSNGLITHTTVADFDNCTVLTNSINQMLTDVVLANGVNGEIRLEPLLEDYFDGPQLDAGRWLVNNGLPTVANGIITVDNGEIRSQASFSQTRIALEGRVQFGGSNLGFDWSDFGFGKPNQIVGPPNIVFLKDPDYNLYANSNHPDDGGPNRNLITPTVDVTDFHNFRLVVNDWRLVGYYVDGSLRHTDIYTPPDFANPIFVDPAYIWFIEGFADWFRVAYYQEPTGTYVSCAQDAGRIVNWGPISWLADTPVGTELSFRTRTSVDGSIWSGWSPPLTSTGSAISSPSGRYLQYMAELSTIDPIESPEVQQVSLNYFGPSYLIVSPNPVTLDPGVLQQFNAQTYDDNDNPIGSLTYSNWQVVNGGGVINSNGLFTAVVTGGSYINTVQVNSAGLTGTATVVVNNLPPVADAGGPYFGSRDQSLILNGLANDANNDDLTFAWDLDGDGQFNDAFLATPNYSWSVVGTYTVTLLVTDRHGLTNTDTALVTVSNPLKTIYLPLIFRYE
jgi:hypothetical protein